MTWHVFVGPSLHGRRLAPAMVRHEPAAVGDLYRVVRQGAKAILLIDGYFHSVPSVQHKEILYAPDRRELLGKRRDERLALLSGLIRRGVTTAELVDQEQVWPLLRCRYLPAPWLLRDAVFATRANAAYESR